MTLTDRGRPSPDRGRQIDRGAKAMAKTEPFEVPLEMRAYAATTVDQARKAFEDFMATARRTVSDLDDRSEAARGEAASINRRFLGAAEEHVAAAFALAQRLVQAETLDEVMALQSAFLSERMSALGGDGMSNGAAGEAGGGADDGGATGVAASAEG
jgi:hypothetical protein